MTKIQPNTNGGVELMDIIETESHFAGPHLRVERTVYKGGESICIWQPFDDDDPDSGLCWDFNSEYLDEAINLLEQCRDNPDRKTVIEVYDAAEEVESWWEWLEGINIRVELLPFDWRWPKKTTFGLSVGPLRLSW